MALFVWCAEVGLQESSPQAAIHQLQIAAKGIQTNQSERKLSHSLCQQALQKSVEIYVSKATIKHLKSSNPSLSHQKNICCSASDSSISLFKKKQISDSPPPTHRARSSTLKGVVPGEVMLVISARWGAGSSTGLKNACRAFCKVADILGCWGRRNLLGCALSKLRLMMCECSSFWCCSFKTSGNILPIGCWTNGFLWTWFNVISPLARPSWTWFKWMGHALDFPIFEVTFRKKRTLFLSTCPFFLRQWLQPALKHP